MWGDRRRMRVGLLGGSFNPAHAGHLHVAKMALARLALDQVWLMVSPGNPLKPARGMMAMADRLAGARKIIRRAGCRRQVVATAIEASLGLRYTVDTLRALRQRFPHTSFVWLMGADNLTQLPHWRRWLDIMRTMPVAVLPRPGYNHRALAGRAALRFAAARVPVRAEKLLARSHAPAWMFLPVSQHAASATQIRAAACPA